MECRVVKVKLNNTRVGRDRYRERHYFLLEKDTPGYAIGGYAMRIPTTRELYTTHNDSLT